MMEIHRNEHPRPDRVRENWCTLNGQWQFAFDPSNAGRREKWYRALPATHHIEVPFCYQSKLSGMREYTRNNVERKFPYCDYELIPKSAWNYGFAGKTLTVEERPVDAVPFSSVNPPLTVKADLAPVAWEWADGFDTVPAVTPVNNIPPDAAQEMALVHYGCAKLRMTELPRLKK